MSDKNRFGLFLSGGMDTRLILACARKNNFNLSTFTINSFKNREVKVAKEAARIAKTPHYFIINKKNHYKKSFPEAIYSTSATYEPQCLFYNHGKDIKKKVDVLDNLIQQNRNLLNVKRIPYFCSGCPHNTSTKMLVS